MRSLTEVRRCSARGNAGGERHHPKGCLSCWDGSQSATGSAGNGADPLVILDSSAQDFGKKELAPPGAHSVCRESPGNGEGARLV